MSVWLRNFQSKILFNEYLLKLHSVFLLHALGVGRFGVSVVCVDEKEIRELNRAYRNEDSSTDVLSFPYHENLVPGELPTPERDCDYNLGDIILGTPIIAQQCVQDGVSLEHRLPVIVTHGLCHLLGYRHGTKTEHTKMFMRERSVLTAFNTTFGTRLRPLTDVH